MEYTTSFFLLMCGLCSFVIMNVSLWRWHTNVKPYQVIQEQVSVDGQYVDMTEIRNSLHQWYKEEDLLSTSGVRTTIYDINWYEKHLWWMDYIRLMSCFIVYPFRVSYSHYRSIETPVGYLPILTVVYNLSNHTLNLYLGKYNLLS